MSDEKQKAHELEATAMVEACAKVLYDISDHARDFEALARRVLADRKAAVEAAVDESFARGVERTKIAEAADRAERIAKVEEAAYDAHEYLPDDMYSAHRAISAIVAAAKGEKP